MFIFYTYAYYYIVINNIIYNDINKYSSKNNQYCKIEVF